MYGIMPKTSNQHSHQNTNLVKNLKPYGFILSDKPGKGTIKRFVNGDTVLKAPSSRTIQMINIAQEVLDFDSAFNYVQSAANEHDLQLKLISCREYDKDSPVKKLFNKLLRKK